MKRTVHIALMLAAILSVEPAFAAPRPPHNATNFDQYVARMPESDTGQFRSRSYPATPSCSEDSNPADPIYFKLADGRCSGD